MNLVNLNHKRVIIAKTNHIGDVVISLPVAAVIKRFFPKAHVIFLSSKAASSITRLFPDIDEVCDWDSGNRQLYPAVLKIKQLNADVFIHLNPCPFLSKVAKQAKIPLRVGSIFRWYQWLSCNRLVRISLEGAGYNKRQLDLQYLSAFGIHQQFSYAEITAFYRFNLTELPALLQQRLETNKFKLILHPTLITAKKYQWPLAYYAELIKLLPQDTFQIFLSGIESDRSYVKESLLDPFPQVIDLLGKLKLDELMSVMQQCDGLIAGSTGPLHLAAALGIHALGIYRSDEKYIKRWEPVGAKAEIVSLGPSCKQCPSGDPCVCITAITPQLVKDRVKQWVSVKI